MIKEFKKEYSWLSNFEPCSIVLDGHEYQSVEHAYMSAKSDDEMWKLTCQMTKSPGLIKKESRKVKLVDNWDEIKLDIMLKCLEQKYSQEPYKSKLIETANEMIQEGNYWNDKFWGVCLKTNQGENRLGKMIMSIRKRLREERC